MRRSRAIAPSCIARQQTHEPAALLGGGAGDAVGFAGDRPHTYANDGKRSARFSLSVYQPGVGAS